MIFLLLTMVAATTAPDSLLARAGFNRPAWESALQKLDGTEHERCVWLLGELTELDLMEIDEVTILGHVRGCTRAVACRPAYRISEDTIRMCVLNPRTGHYDMVTDWRSGLWAVFRDSCTGDFNTDASMVGRFLREHVAIETRADAFGPPSPPLGTLRRGWGSAEEWASLAVASLRAIGVAARACEGSRGVEVWDGLSWQRIHPTEGDSQMADEPTSLAKMDLRLTSDGEPWHVTDHLGLSRWSGGAWRPVEPPVHPVSADVTDTSILITAPEGDYLVTAGVRNARGEPRVWCRRIELTADSVTALSADLSIPFAEMSQQDLVESPEPALAGVVLRDTLGHEVALKDLVGMGRPLLIVAREPGGELSERLLRVLKDHVEDLEAQGIVQIPVVPNGIGGRTAWVDVHGTLWSALGLDRGRAPALLLVSAQGQTLVFKRNARPHAVELALNALRGSRCALPGTQSAR